MSSMQLMHQVSGVQTMSSREIAELTGKEHRNVMRDARAMLVELYGEGGVLSFEHTQVNPQNGQPYPVLNLPKRETMILISGYSIPLRAKIIDRWQELEAAASAPAIPQTMPEALRLAAQALEDAQNARAAQVKAEVMLQLEAKRTGQLEAQVADVAPKAAALDRLAVQTDGAVCIRVAAKLAQVPEKQFISFLHSEQWIFRHHHSQRWMGRSEKERAGLLELKRTTVVRDDGSEKAVEQVLLTPRGQARITELIERKAPHLRKVVAPV